MAYIEKDNIEEPIIRLYKYGSSVYGTENENSDLDYIVVVESDDDLYYNVNKDNTNFTVYSENRFIMEIENHSIHILECIFQDDNDPYLKYFILDRDKLRRAVSSVASNSFVKCKKKLADGEYYIGKKSLFHSLRILIYGIQIGYYGKIVDYKDSSRFYFEIMSADTNDWNYFKDKYQPIYNYLKSTFKTVAPLKEEEQ